MGLYLLYLMRTVLYSYSESINPFLAASKLIACDAHNARVQQLLNVWAIHYNGNDILCVIDNWISPWYLQGIY